MLDLYCCADFSLAAAGGEYCLVATYKLLNLGASLAQHRLSGTWASVAAAGGSVGTALGL